MWKPKGVSGEEAVFTSMHEGTRERKSIIINALPWKSATKNTDAELRSYHHTMIQQGGGKNPNCSIPTLLQLTFPITGDLGDGTYG